jgi:hypothetical protein
MAVMIVNFDILTDDKVVSQSIHRKLVEELNRGRSKFQIHFEDNICYISTPEDVYALAKRLIGMSDLRIEKDGLVIIDKQYKKICVWGVCNMKIFEQFPRYKLVNI